MNTKNNDKLMINISQENKKKVREIAEKEGLGISPFVRRILLEKINREAVSQ
jgi:hypothetical protein